MSILEHIAELRDRLIRSCLALAVTTIVTFAVGYNPILHFITRSYCSIPARYRVTTAAGDCRLLATSPLDPFSIRIRVALTVGLVAAMPYIAFQIWRFITPGLKRNEKRYAVPFSVVSTILFAAGVAVAFYTLPRAIGVLVAIGGDSLATFFTADRYLRFVLFMGLAFGLAFEFPLVLVSLSMVGILSSGAMLRAWRPAVAVIVVVAAVATPSQDPFSLFMMAVPLWLFYFAAAAVARFFIEPARARRRAQLDQGSQ
ncbi:MAG TPA: twin-arginine translocase subunit TatC [Actinomycetota bacterium]|jgi:sec-independent protein translocase protein TatC|nr:twin-arginine translocase subunit TatC [Actinomycetota bacterium]